METPFHSKTPLPFKREELKKAAIKGDVEFIRKTIASNKPNNFYLKVFTKYDQLQNHDHHYGNIFHMAASESRNDFIREAIKSLPQEVVKQLLIQQDEDMNNPLHIASIYGNIEIVKVMLSFVKSLPQLLGDNIKPWLEKNYLGQSPCHSALNSGHIDCGLEILKMDVDLLSNMRDNRDCGLLCSAVARGSNKFALEILRCAKTLACNCQNGLTPFHHLACCSEGEEIFKLLLEREPELIKQKTKADFAALHSWANVGKLWLFETFLKSNNIIPNPRKVLVDLMSINDTYGFNPFHVLAAQTLVEKDAIQIAKLLIYNYKQEKTTNLETKFPWLVQDKKGNTPLSLAINRRYQVFAMLILSVDDINAIMSCKGNVLFNAIEKGCYLVVEKILEIVEKHGFTQLYVDDQQQNVLHLAPKCPKILCERLFKKHPELLEGVDKYGNTILHNWAKMGQAGPLAYIFQSGEIDIKWRNHIIKLITTTNHKGYNPFHSICTMLLNETISLQFTKLLVKAYKEGTSDWACFAPSWLPWFAKNSIGDGPLNLAIEKGHEKLALYLLSLHESEHVNELLDYYKGENNILILAIENKCYKVAKEIMTRLDKECWEEYLKDSFDGNNVLHLAPNCKDKDFAKWMVNEAPQFITKRDDNGNTPLDEACEIGADWIIKSMLKKDPLALSKVPLAWIKACENDNISTIHVFINNDPIKFKDHCIKHKETPLHHIELFDIKEYEDFLKAPYMKDLINVQDLQGNTPLHKAIQNRDILFTEVLLGIDKIKYNVKNQENQTALDLLDQICYEKRDWDGMCKRIGFDSNLKTTFMDKDSEAQDTKEFLLLLAALLAVITFLSGFNLGGEINKMDGETILAKKAIFFLFLISDTLAFCCSMVVLVSYIRSIWYDEEKSLLVIDRSMVLLVVAAYSTLLAFMSGLYIVISPNTLWGTIVFIVMCFLIVISTKGALLHKFLEKVVPSAKKTLKIQFAW